MILESTFTPVFLVLELFLPQKALLVVKTPAYPKKMAAKAGKLVSVIAHKEKEARNDQV